LENCGSRTALVPVHGHVAVGVPLDYTPVEEFGNHGLSRSVNCTLRDDSKPPLDLVAVGGKAKLNRLTPRKMNSRWEWCSTPLL
jgi:hypothetical protein